LIGCGETGAANSRLVLNTCISTRPAVHTAVRANWSLLSVQFMCCERALSVGRSRMLSWRDGAHLSTSIDQVAFITGRRPRRPGCDAVGILANIHCSVRQYVFYVFSNFQKRDFTFFSNHVSIGRKKSLAKVWSSILRNIRW